MWRIWLLFDPRRALVALFTFLFGLALRDPLHPAQHRPVQLAGRSAHGAAPARSALPPHPPGSRELTLPAERTRPERVPGLVRRRSRSDDHGQRSCRGGGTDDGDAQL